MTSHPLRPALVDACCVDCYTRRALNTMVYYGLSLNTPNLYGDMYVNFFVGQVVEIPSVVVTMWLIYRYRSAPSQLIHLCTDFAFSFVVFLFSPPGYTERQCAVAVGTVPVPWAGNLQC